MIQRTSYNSGTLKATLAVYENRFGLSSDDFYAAHVEDAPLVESIPGYHRHLWASMYRELQMLGEQGDLPRRIERELELA